jgi:arsenite methyltransferase
MKAAIKRKLQEMSKNLYENELFTEITGPSIRPGGFKITKEGIDACNFHNGARILDIGCGRGASAEFIEREYGFSCAGIDISEALISEGLKRNKALLLTQGDAHELPFADGSMDGVIMECSFSLMEDGKKVLGEARRVLKDGGRLVISDLYVREDSKAAGAETGEGCPLTALGLGEFNALLNEYGFAVALFKDYTRELKALMVEIILKHGSMRSFWEQADCRVPCGATNIKLGYFLSVARLKIQENV